MNIIPLQYNLQVYINTKSLVKIMYDYVYGIYNHSKYNK